MKLNRPLLVAKLKAIAAHLLISCTLVGIALALMWFVWFPPPLFATDGGGLGLKLLLLVDLVLGPLLTFVVFNPAKSWRELRIDLGVIAVLQLAAYGYGLHSIYSVRVQALAWHEGVFHPVSAGIFKSQDLSSGWNALGDGEPYLVNTREPANQEEATGVAAFGLLNGTAPYQLQFLYEPLSKAWPQVRAGGVDLKTLQTRDADTAARARHWLDRHGGLDATTLRFYRVEGFYENAVLVLDGEGRWIGGFRGDLKPSSSSASPRS